MKSVAQFGTKIEVDLVKALRSSRFTFEENVRVVPDLTTKPDIVFRRRRVAVYLDGCFWHSCPHHSSPPRSNSGFWEEKLSRNVERDQANTKALQERGWKVIRLWGHQSTDEMFRTVERALKAG